MNRLFAIASVSALIFAGCTRPTTVERQYGHRRGAHGGRSVNGTGVLAELFVANGHRVSTRNRLSPSLERVDAIVWAPNDFGGPDDEQREFLESWLDAEDDRTLIYIGRDFDASIEYWQPIARSASAQNGEKVERSLAKARSKFAAERSDIPETADFGWLVLERHDVAKRVEKIEGPWSEGISAADANIVLMSRFLRPGESSASVPSIDAHRPKDGHWDVKPLLTTDGHAFAFQLESNYSYNSKIIVITNGSFVLNAPLVNEEHRKLANKLVAATGPPRHIVFLESGRGGPTIVDYDSGIHHLLRYLTVWPLNYLFMQAMILGVVYCFSVFPVFGYARRLPPATRSDFGDHILALGRLFSQSQDEEFARARLKHFDEIVQREDATPSPLSIPLTKHGSDSSEED